MDLPAMLWRLLPITAVISMLTACGVPEQPRAAVADAPPQRLFADSEHHVYGRFSVEITGRGPDVVLIPGLASARDVWRHTAEELRDTHRLHLIQVAGFAGEAARDNAEGAVFIPTAQALHDYIVDSGLAPATLVGHSMGGAMSVYLAQTWPQAVRKVLIVDSLPAFASIMRAAASQQTQSTSPPANEAEAKQMQRRFMALMVSAPSDVERVVEWSDRSDRRTVTAAFSDLMALDLGPGLASMQLPVTLFYATGTDPERTATIDGMYRDAYAPLPGVRLVAFAGSRHFIQLDQPDRFVHELREFLR